MEVDNIIVSNYTKVVLGESKKEDKMYKDLSLKEVIRKKDLLEEIILEAIKKFAEETGLEVENINLRKVYSLNNLQKEMTVGVEIKVDI